MAKKFEGISSSSGFGSSLSDFHQNLMNFLNKDAKEDNVPLNYKPLIGVSILTVTFIAIVIPFFPSAAMDISKQLPFQGTTLAKRDQIISLIKQANSIYPRVTSKSEFLDLGSGDGRILRHLAKDRSMQNHFTKFRGVETNASLFWLSRLLSIRSASITFAKRDFFSLTKLDLAQVDTVMLFGIPALMESLRDKFERDLTRENAFFISNKFPLPDRTPDFQDGEMFLYVLNKKRTDL